MALSAAERVKRWQTKSRLKAFYFDDIDERRRLLLAQQFAKTEGDEGAKQAIAELFYGLPRCVLAPKWIGPHLDGWGVSFPNGATVWEEAIACMALDDYWLDSPIYIDHQVGSMSAPVYLYPELQAEIDHLKGLGLWNTTPVGEKPYGRK